MTFDNRTVILATMLVGVVLTVAMAGIAGTERRYRGPWWWFAGNLGGTLGLALTATQGQLPPLVSVILANLMVLAGYMSLGVGLCVFLERPVPRRTLLAIMAAVAALFIYLTYLSPSINLRVLVLSLAMAWVLAHMAHQLLRPLIPLPRPIRLVTALIVTLFSLFHVARGALSLLAPPMPLQTLMAPSPLVATVFFLSMIVWLALMLCLIMMLSLRLERELQERIGDLDQEILLRQALEERLAREATQDPLTGAANRRKLEELAAKSLAVTRRHQRPFALAILDIDHFKAINDRLGHQAGDQALVDLAELCQSRLREEDTLARFGGDEFVVLLPYANLDQALETAERLRREVERLGRGTESPHPGLTISLGVAQFVSDDPGVEAILARADAALYQAKTSGRNRVCYARSEADGGLWVGCHPPSTPLAA